MQGVFLLDSSIDLGFMIRQVPVMGLDSTTAVDYAAEAMSFMGKLPYGWAVIRTDMELRQVEEALRIEEGPTKATRFLGKVGSGFDVRLVSTGSGSILSSGVLIQEDGSITIYGEGVSRGGS